jgi:hypothetical protein
MKMSINIVYSIYARQTETYFLTAFFGVFWVPVVEIQQTNNGICDILYTSKQLNAGVCNGLYYA